MKSYKGGCSGVDGELDFIARDGLRGVFRSKSIFRECIKFLESVKRQRYKVVRVRGENGKFYDKV